MKITSSNVSINGPVGQIEATFDLPETISQSGFVSVNCHPHSLHGGSMTNKVVHTVSRSIASKGIPSVRFNFRGVGKSEGKYDEGIGEQDDLKAVVDWAKEQFPKSQLMLSGFSFGSYVSAFAAKLLAPKLLISVAPPVKRFDFSRFERPSCDWRVIMGTEDELVEYKEVVDWVKSFEKAPQLITIEDASHFFHGKLVQLRSEVETIVSEHL